MACDQTQPGSFSREKKEPGNEVGYKCNGGFDWDRGATFRLGGTISAPILMGGRGGGAQDTFSY